jgi:hypothetical protein
MSDDGPADKKPEIMLQTEQMAGVWANFAAVSHSEHEFTIDFVRMDATAPPPGRGIVVARVAMSPLFVTQLIDALQKNWSGYAQKALPKEARGESVPEPREAGASESPGEESVPELEDVGSEADEAVPEGEGENGSEEGEEV